MACVEQAKAAAGDRDVMMHAAYTARECLRARVLDVLEIQLVRALESPSALHLRYEVRYA
jgi:hypothetical protein